METLEQVHERGWTHGGLDMALIRYGARWEPEPESKRAYLTGFHSAQRYMDHPDGHKLPPARMSLYGSQDHQYNAGTTVNELARGRLPVPCSPLPSPLRRPLPAPPPL